MNIPTYSQILFSAFSFLILPACMTAPQSTLSTTSENEVLLLSEYGKLLTAPTSGGEAHEIPHLRPIGGIRGSSVEPGVIAGTWNELGQPIIEMLSLDGAVKHTYPLTNKVRMTTPSPDGRWIAYTLGQSGIFISELGNIGKERFYPIPDAIEINGLSWSRDQQQIAFIKRLASSEVGKFLTILGVLNISNGDIQILTGPQRPNQPVFSPDGKLLAYFDTDWQLRLQNVVVSDLRSLDNTNRPTTVITRSFKKYRHFQALQWSPSGEWLFWAELQHAFPDLYKSQVDGSHFTEIEIHRPWLSRIWRNIWPLEEAHRPCCLDYVWYEIPQNYKLSIPHP